MTYSQYLRIETKAGGTSCTPRQFIKAAHTLLSERGKSHECRRDRHRWLRLGLAHLDNAQNLRTTYHI
jgi:hypothetical protein